MDILTDLVVPTDALSDTDSDDDTSNSSEASQATPASDDGEVGNTDCQPPPPPPAQGSGGDGTVVQGERPLRPPSAPAVVVAAWQGHDSDANMPPMGANTPSDEDAAVSDLLLPTPAAPIALPQDVTSGAAAQYEEIPCDNTNGVDNDEQLERAWVDLEAEQAGEAMDAAWQKVAEEHSSTDDVTGDVTDDGGGRAAARGAGDVQRLVQPPVASVAEALAVPDAAQRLEDVRCHMLDGHPDGTPTDHDGTMLATLVASEFELSVCAAVAEALRKSDARVHQGVADGDNHRAMLAALQQEHDAVAATKTTVRASLAKKIAFHTAELRAAQATVQQRRTAHEALRHKPLGNTRVDVATTALAAAEAERSRLEQLHRSLEQPDAFVQQKLRVAHATVEHLQHVIRTDGVPPPPAPSASSAAARARADVVDASLQRAHRYRALAAGAEQGTASEAEFDPSTSLLLLLAEEEEERAHDYDVVQRCLEHVTAWDAGADQEHGHAKQPLPEIAAAGNDADGALVKVCRAIDRTVMEGLACVHEGEAAVELGLSRDAVSAVAMGHAPADATLATATPAFRQHVTATGNKSLKQEAQCIQRRALLMLGSEVSRLFEHATRGTSGDIEGGETRSDSAPEDAAVPNADCVEAQRICHAIVQELAAPGSMAGLTSAQIRADLAQLGAARQAQFAAMVAAAVLDKQGKRMCGQLGQSRAELKARFDAADDCVHALAQCVHDGVLGGDTAVQAGLLCKKIHAVETTTLPAAHMDVRHKQGALAAHVRIAAGKTLGAQMKARAQKLIDGAGGGTRNAVVVQALGQVTGKLAAATAKIASRSAHFPSGGSPNPIARLADDPNLADPSRAYGRPWMRKSLRRAQRGSGGMDGIAVSRRPRSHWDRVNTSARYAETKSVYGAPVGGGAGTQHRQRRRTSTAARTALHQRSRDARAPPRLISDPTADDDEGQHALGGLGIDVPGTVPASTSPETGTPTRTSPTPQLQRLRLPRRRVAPLATKPPAPSDPAAPSPYTAVESGFTRVVGGDGIESATPTIPALKKRGARRKVSPLKNPYGTLSPIQASAIATAAVGQRKHGGGNTLAWNERGPNDV